MGQRTGNSRISLVFREMWDPQASFLNSEWVIKLEGGARVSHISRKTSEIWGTHWSVVRAEFGPLVLTRFVSSLKAANVAAWMDPRVGNPDALFCGTKAIRVLV
jgi:hypothetical protein